MTRSALKRASRPGEGLDCEGDVLLVEKSGGANPASVQEETRALVVSSLSPGERDPLPVRRLPGGDLPGDLGLREAESLRALDSLPEEPEGEGGLDAEVGHALTLSDPRDPVKAGSPREPDLLLILKHVEGLAHSEPELNVPEPYFAVRVVVSVVWPEPWPVRGHHPPCPGGSVVGAVGVPHSQVFALKVPYIR